MKRGRVADPQIGDTPVSCRRDRRGDFVTMADAIENSHRAPSRPYDSTDFANAFR